MELWWQLFAWAVGIVTLVFLTQRGAVGQPIALAFGLAFVRLVLSVGLIGFGYGLEPALWSAIQDGLDKGFGMLGTLLGSNALGLFASGLIPGSLALLVAATAPNQKERVQRSVIAVILCIALADIVWNVVNTRPLEGLLFSLFSDVLGGVLAGIIIATISTLGAEPVASAPKVTTAEG